MRLYSLQEALYESATDYYGAHSKRVRRKKNRYSHQATSLPPGSGPSTGRPLRSEGWTVRYEYKMATFAEFRMEDELARKFVAFPLFSPYSFRHFVDTTRTAGRLCAICSVRLLFCLQELKDGQKQRSWPIPSPSR
jgi:hypothetical protein